jgi:hypothetical protein
MASSIQLSSSEPGSTSRSTIQVHNDEVKTSKHVPGVREVDPEALFHLGEEGEQGARCSYIITSKVEASDVVDGPFAGNLYIWG